MDHSTDILERIAEFKIGLNNWEWTDYISGKPDGFDDMNCEEKLNPIRNMTYKLDLMLNSPGETLVDWIYFHKHLEKTFDEFMASKVSRLPDIPSPTKSFKDYFKNLFT